LSALRELGSRGRFPARICHQHTHEDEVQVSGDEGWWKATQDHRRGPSSHGHHHTIHRQRQNCIVQMHAAHLEAWSLSRFNRTAHPWVGWGGGSRPRRAVDGDYDGPLLAAVDVFTYPCRSCSSAHVFDFRWTMPIRSLAGLSAKLLAVQASCLQAKSARF